MLVGTVQVGEKRAVQLPHLGDLGSLYSGFWRPLGDIVGSAQTNALPAGASSWLLSTLPFLPGAALPLELTGAGRT